MYLQSFLKARIKFYFSRVVIAILIGVSCGCSSGSSIIIANVPENSANDILLVLGNNRITASTELHKDGTYSILVEEAQKLKALSILSSNGLPKTNYTNLGDVFKKDSLISSPMEEYNRNIYALDQEISNMLSSLNGVISVHTKVALPKPNDKLWQTDVPPPSASVLIIFKQGTRIDLYTNKIKALVSHAVEGLTSDQVEVVAVSQRAF